MISLEKPWEKPFKSREEARAALSTMGLIFHIDMSLGIVFAVLGAISDALNIILVLEPISWLLLAVVCLLAGMPEVIIWALAMHLLGIESESKKRE